MQDPSNVSAQALFAQATACLAAGQPLDAVDPLVQCMRAAPEFGPGYVTLAQVLHKFGLLDQALTMVEAGVALLPGSEAALASLAAILHDRADYPGAIGLYRQMLDRNPDHAGLVRSLAGSLQAMGGHAEALPLHARAVALAPADVEAHYGYADALLASGALAAGWREYEWRWQRPGHHDRGFGPAWAGEDLAGRTILLHAEQGFGDTLQFARYAPLVADCGARVVLEVQPALVRLMRSLPGVTAVIAQGDALPAFDTHCPLLSLPRGFGTVLETIPDRTPYLHADQALVAAWAPKLPAGPARRVGVVWAGSAHADASGLQVFDQRRSLPLAAFAPLAGLGAHLISLQAGPPAAAIDAGPAMLDVMSGVTDFADTAAIIAGLDLVISVDTAVAHLAGALGCPVWLLSRKDGCWRWLHGRADSPWYPTMRIYRQTRAMVWDDVVAEIAADLAALMDRGRTGKARGFAPGPHQGRSPLEP